VIQPDLAHHKRCSLIHESARFENILAGNAAGSQTSANMPSKYLVFRFNNLPPDITRPQIEQRITPIARNRQCTFSVGPVVNIYNKTDLHVASRSTTITIEGDSCEKVLSNLRHLWITSDSNGTEAFADEKFLGQTVLAENDESTLE
jgi:hypothetical protein